MARSERQWLKNIETGGIFASNKQLLKMKEMVPCESPDVEKEVPGAEHVMIEAEKPVEEEKVSDTLSKEEGSMLIQKWFDRPVDKVKVIELYEYAKERTGEDFPEKMTKLQIVTKLAAELAVREE